MSLDEFWRSSPAEMAELMAGYEFRLKMTQRLLAWHAANVMNASGFMKRAITMKDLMPDDEPPQAKKNREQARRDWLELQDMFGVKGKKR